MSASEALSEAVAVITNGVNLLSGTLSTLGYFMLPVAFVFSRKLIGVVKQLTFNGGRRK